MPRDIQSVPMLAEYQKLPARCVGHLHDQPSVRQQQFSDGFQVRNGIAQMLQHVEHVYGGDSTRSDRRLVEVAANILHAVRVLYMVIDCSWLVRATVVSCMLAYLTRS